MIRRTIMLFFLLLTNVGAEISFLYLDAEDLVENHLVTSSSHDDEGTQVQIRNVESSSRPCIALYTNGHDSGKKPTTDTYLLPDEGVILGTGNILDFGDNDSDGTTTNFREDTGEIDLESHVTGGAAVYDPCYVQFDFKCPPDDDHDEEGRIVPTVNLDYVFGSDEYFDQDGDYDCGGNEDAFGAFVNGANIALLPDGSPITVGNINGMTNSQHFLENELRGRTEDNRTSLFDSIEADGLTTRLTASWSDEALSSSDMASSSSSSSSMYGDGWNTMKLVLGDVGDGEVDSWVLIGAGPIACTRDTTSSDYSTTSSKTTPTRAPITTTSTTVTNRKVDAAIASATSSTTTAKDNVPSTYNRVPMPLAVIVILLLGLFALSLPIIALVICNNKRE